MKPRYEKPWGVKGRGLGLRWANRGAPKPPPHWYRLHRGACPVCGRDQSWRERVVGPRPADVEKRVVYIPDSETYDHCMERG